MQIILDDDVRARLGELLARAPGKTPGELVNSLLRLQLDQSELRRRYDELKRLIQEGLDSADRGELLDGEEVFDEILAELSEPKAQQV